MNQYVSHITYDAANPLLTQPYSSTASLQNQYQASSTAAAPVMESGIECIKMTRDVVGNDRSYWKMTFPKTAKELLFDSTKYCSFYTIIYILQDKMKHSFSVANVKSVLITSYREYLSSYLPAILNTLKQQGKRRLVDKVKSGAIQFDDMIMSEDYYLTNLDLWAIATKLQLPIVLFSTNKLSNLGLDVRWVVLGGNVKKDAYYFVRSPTQQAGDETIRGYNIISPAMPLSNLPGFPAMVESAANGNADYVDHIQTLETFLRRP
jgi:hypothetical protein